MFMLLKRYIPRFLLVFLSGFVVWGLISVYTDGVLPWASLLVWVIVTLMTIPYLIYCDFRDIKSMALELRSAYRGDVSLSSTQAISVATGKICEKFGVPEFMVSAAINRIEERLSNRSSSTVNETAEINAIQ